MPEASLPIRPTEPTLRLIITYKFVRSALAFAASALLAGFAITGRTTLLHDFASALRHHVTSAWSIELADAAVRAIVPRRVWILAGALALDGTFTFVEGLSLLRGWWWGPWLVVVATASFVPFEFIAVAHRFALGRVLILAINVAVAVYLGVRVARRLKAERVVSQASREGPPS